ncbi:MAG TPA: sodium:proton antiporter [Firmicutes bacterium]|nr:sodium:proton antiporter [Bacillota bacterium]
MESIILRTVVRIVLPFIQMYGLYVILNGHISPGGGFPGGAILGTGMILYAVTFGLKEGIRKISPDVFTLMESGGALWYGVLGLGGILLGANYLSNKAAGIPLGEPGTLFSSGLVFLITIGIGIKVASTFITLFYNLGEGKTRVGNFDKP